MFVEDCDFIVSTFIVFTELERSQNDLNSLKKQAEGVSTEYDRLLKEHADLQVRKSILPRRKIQVLITNM